jgi:hypothetical protein
VQAHGRGDNDRGQEEDGFGLAAGITI